MGGGVPIGDGWEEVRVRNVLHYVPVLHPGVLDTNIMYASTGDRTGAQIALAKGPKKSRFSGHTPSNAPRNDVAPLKIITYRAIKTTGTLIVNTYD